MPPPFNLIISNVPGSGETRCFDGARMAATYPISGVAPMKALNVTVSIWQRPQGAGLSIGRQVWYLGGMRSIPYLHDFMSELPEPVQGEIERLSTVRRLARGEAAYRKDDPPVELFRLLEGAIKLCNYSLDGAEIITGEFRPRDCFGEMGVLDGLPRLSHAIASRDSRVGVLSKQNFDSLCDRYPEIYKQLNRMLCSRVRFLYSLNEDAAGLKLHVRLARLLHRLAYSHGQKNEQSETYIEISHEELSNMLGASRQGVSKELKLLEREGDIKLRYGRIYICDLQLLGEQYEKAIGMEQVTPLYIDEK